MKKRSWTKSGPSLWEYLKARLNHMAYNPDGGTWTLAPGGHQQAHYDINTGETVKIELFVGVNFGKEDQINLVNPRPFDPTVIRYEYFEEEGTL